MDSTISVEEQDLVEGLSFHFLAVFFELFQDGTEVSWTREFNLGQGLFVGCKNPMDTVDLRIRLVPVDWEAVTGL